MGTDRASGQSQPDKDEPIEERPKADETFGLFYAPTMGESGSGFFVPMHPAEGRPWRAGTRRRLAAALG